jgi:exo-beta-1,3-glucanase (GH17 family)
MILGVFIDKDHGIGGAQEQVTEIIAWAQWDLVELIIVGNEAVGSGACDASTLAGFVSSSKSAFKGAGYTGPVTLTETLNIWQEYTELFCSVVDIVGTNIHAFFNPQTVAKDAGKFVKSQLEIADAFCPGKYAINCETGWPSYSTECNGLACGGVQEQADAIKSITEEIGGKSVMFSFTNDKWKPPGAFGCEQSWGAIQLFG